MEVKLKLKKIKDKGITIGEDDDGISTQLFRDIIYVGDSAEMKLSFNMVFESERDIELFKKTNAIVKVVFNDTNR